MRGGKAFNKPLPFALGTNGEIIDYGPETTALEEAQAIGMKWWREEVPWNFSKGEIVGFEETPGTYNSTTATTVASAVSTIKSYGLTPLLVVTVNAAPALSSTWTSGVPCTPAQLAAAMAWIVAQPGLQGLHWEILNEPDGESWHATPALLTEAYSLAYPAMKAADPTCTIHGMVLEAISPTGYFIGMDYWNECYSAGMFTGNTGGTPWMDVEDNHIYFVSVNGETDDLSPDAYGGANQPVPGWLAIANWQANRISHGVTIPLAISEFGWNSTGDGQMTPQLQAQFYQNFLVSLSGYDPVNKVQFSSYLAFMCQFAMGNEGVEWGVYGQPAAAILAELVAGN